MTNFPTISSAFFSKIFPQLVVHFVSNFHIYNFLHFLTNKLPACRPNLFNFFYICLRILFTAMILCNLFSELSFILKRKSNIYMLEVLGPGGLPDFGSLDFVLRKLQAIQGVRFLMICLHFSRFKSAFFNLT